MFKIIQTLATNRRKRSKYPPEVFEHLPQIVANDQNYF